VRLRATPREQISEDKERERRTVIVAVAIVTYVCASSYSVYVSATTESMLVAVTVVVTVDWRRGATSPAAGDAANNSGTTARRATLKNMAYSAQVSCIFRSPLIPRSAPMNVEVRQRQ
jgi:hypothetical protein